MLLKPNMNWAANQGIALPTVMATITASNEFLQVDFSVEEPIDCFRAEVMEDGGHSWEDSCIEIFLQNPANPAEYYNFETTSRGYLLAARGTDRNNRTDLDSAQLAQVQRSKQLASVIGDFVCWGMSVRIPASLFGLTSFEGVQLRGNLYKCADKAKTPHYLSAFPIETEKPDFHRPEFFDILV
ncbi:carbohydrate-binding family 9-like protein [Fibrobacter sp. UBA4309]|uniref:carbohydrate-binding family 9-like protein n=1 Tax=Fibrobacter sp. UBA4309 TaxID=1946537 RepID=UPI0025C6FCB6|nr:carbohydrate-binding family 9-like protein [Fibrobacter sp. UBA4309]